VSKSGGAERNADVPEETFEREVQDKTQMPSMLCRVAKKGTAPVEGLGPWGAISLYRLGPVLDHLNPGTEIGTVVLKHIVPRYTGRHSMALALIARIPRLAVVFHRDRALSQPHQVTSL
jgi:hypothetical protein